VKARNPVAAKSPRLVPATADGNAPKVDPRAESQRRKFNFAFFLDHRHIAPVFRTKLGALFDGDALAILPSIAAESVDTIFADPPFNIGKKYGSIVNDRRAEHDYLRWCYSWLDQCIRILKDGGSLFSYNLPRWNVILANFLLSRGMNFRDWIVIDIKLGLPIPGRLYPSHYSLLYFSKGEVKTFHKIRTQIQTCRHQRNKPYRRLVRHPARSPLEIQIQETKGKCSIDQTSRSGGGDEHGQRRCATRSLRGKRYGTRRV
jgi:hypothetical protein